MRSKIDLLTNLKYLLSVSTEKFWQCFMLTLSLVFTMVASPLHANESAALESLKSGNHFAIMRHAIAPGMGDPYNFDVKNCATQRNLSQDGIDQSINIGKKLRDSGITDAQVFTSQWCRCIDTAKYLDLNEAVELPIINSFFQNRELEPAQTQSLKTWIIEQDLTKPLILVTHQVNITALTGVYPVSGEIIIIKRKINGSLVVTNRVLTD